LFRAKAIDIFGLDAVCSPRNLNKLIMNKSVGAPPVPRGAPKTVPDSITSAVLDYCRVLRAYLLPVFRSTVITAFKNLIRGCDLGLKFMKDHPDDDTVLIWDEAALDNWYKRRFLGDNADEVSTGLQLPLDVTRDAWCTIPNFERFYGHTKDQLLEVCHAANEATRWPNMR
jgi:hypothetical protein